MQGRPIHVHVAPEVLALGINAVFLAIRGMTNRESDPEFDAHQAAVIQKIRTEYSREPLLADPFLQGYRDLHTAIGFSNRNFVAAPENLIENLFKYGRLPHVNLLVDIYNLVSVETRLSLGAHDIDKIQGDVNFRLTTGQEGFWPLGSPEPKRVRPGGYAYIDDANDVICMLEVRQVEKTKAGLDSRDVFYIVQGNPAVDLETLQACARQLAALTCRYLGGEVELLTP